MKFDSNADKGCEFGGYHINGDVDEYAIMKYIQEKGVGCLDPGTVTAQGYSI
ncbi:hypothetical protein MH215_17660 [Paenibacillus sp. ACRSA]|uniref:hypothetical protein n=1 Tax=Paenibacillus sp. ACRSA TaxID=2918211 RepID=UPI001EF68C7B|nr:hypothetical protein [Paenibacillus sp. ACRSA]MCG7378840.1 hypothetical protein [Paenibacillus sp. ACRSA]